jgi:death-on-curing protein
MEIETVLAIHNQLILSYGGLSGVRDHAALEAALARMNAGMANEEFYPDEVHKAAALVESIIVNHPFLDGNKRIGYVLMRLFLNKNGFDILATEDEKFDFIISIASGQLHFESIVIWLKKHTKKGS